AQGGAGHIDAGRTDKHAKPLVEPVLLVENSSTKGFVHLSAQLRDHRSRLKRAQCPRDLCPSCRESARGTGRLRRPASVCPRCLRGGAAGLGGAEPCVPQLAALLASLDVE